MSEEEREVIDQIERLVLAVAVGNQTLVEFGKDFEGCWMLTVEGKVACHSKSIFDVWSTLEGMAFGLQHQMLTQRKNLIHGAATGLTGGCHLPVWTEHLLERPEHFEVIRP